MKRVRFFYGLVLLAGLTVLGTWAQEAENSSPSPRANSKWQQWLEEVDLLITEEERSYFLAIEQEFRRKSFVEAFWRERDPDPLTHMNELRFLWEERLALSWARWQSVLDSRAQVLLVSGEPHSICYARTTEQETWYYRRGENEFFPITFLRTVREHPYEIWLPNRLLQHAVHRQRAKQASLSEMCGQDVASLYVRRNANDVMAGFEYEQFLKNYTDPRVEPSVEWLPTFAANTTDLPADASTFPMELQMSFPGRHQQRTVVQGLVVVPAGAVETLEVAGEVSHRLQLIGEVVRDDELFESFRYQFALPAGEASAVVPLVFQRYLRPGKITLLVKVEDLYGRRFARVEQILEVPQVEEIAEVPGPADSELFGLFVEADAAAARGEHLLRLVPPSHSVFTGLVRFDTVVSGNFDRVTFSIDDKPILSKRRPPYSVELDLGPTPVPHRLRVSATNREGEELASDELQLNPGGQRFRVRITEPRSGGHYRKSFRVVLDVITPDREPVERVELFLGERPVATLHQPPFVQPVLLEREGETVYLRAVAYLPDGHSTEDVVFVNAPDFLDEIEVQMVEIYASALDRRGRPVLGLEEAVFAVEEDGVRQQLRRFEWVNILPIQAALLLDVSASMEDSLENVGIAARDFVEQIVQPKDRLALLTFNHQPLVVERFTNNIESVQASLAALRAEGGTALYDSVVFALHYFHGMRGQRVLLLLSDGHDESSRFTFEDTLDYVRRAGITVYAIGLKEAAQKRAHRKVLERISEETGGRAFFVEELEELNAIYSTIQEELRSRYLLVYQSNSAKDSAEFRRVEVKVEGAALVRAMRGYYP
jgi:Ca-activated chloride channel family protein